LLFNFVTFLFSLSFFFYPAKMIIKEKKNIMERARARHRQWRQSMSSSQRPAYLARRHAQARGKQLVVETDYRLEACPSTKKKSQKDEGVRRRVSVFSLGWRMGTSVKMNIVYLNELILKEWKKKENEQYVFLYVFFLTY
jgi:hypothetical protein